ncbi:peptide chain release factor N(5)-glutamine methyltransferase [Candidatus Nitrotoga sp. 1052]|uniref:peptide chain release factor N(5)-glutamine methyltransferase n=1 Tax=Candidatus Nitrotoga sp. 1052 TaxID=2886964 RepID=UPI001EF71B9F|nr:peptide chain release factor N(5)-glutamine methyltransferase [Candidatus Nitrotoga sp. 1052]CAH1082310.1 protein-(glutamine-N(5)) methyltransferase [Candidatus Nitrotoga sp. 1052]
MLRTIQEALLQDAVRLTEALAINPSSARIEIQCLLQQVLNVPRAWLLAHSEHYPNETEQIRYHELLQRRLRGEPVAYLLGEREFFGLMLKVTPATLIPRPETELLVELVLPRISQQGLCRVLDLGTGSGAIALALAHARPDVEVLGCDASTTALAVAHANARQLAIANAAFIHSDWFEAFKAQKFNIIVSNPPYIAAGDPHLARGDVRFEPISALVSGGDGLHDIRHIAAHAPDYLEPGGWLLLEHGYDQAAQVRELLQQAGFDVVFSACDLAGIERVSGGRIA